MADRSLPSWECGLKYQKRKTPIRVSMSLPSWECGLKLWYGYIQKNENVEKGRHLPIESCS